VPARPIAPSEQAQATSIAGQIEQRLAPKNRLEHHLNCILYRTANNQATRTLSPGPQCWDRTISGTSRGVASGVAEPARGRPPRRGSCARRHERKPGSLHHLVAITVPAQHLRHCANQSMRTPSPRRRGAGVGLIASRSRPNPTREPTGSARHRPRRAHGPDRLGCKSSRRFSADPRRRQHQLRRGVHLPAHQLTTPTTASVRVCTRHAVDPSRNTHSRVTATVRIGSQRLMVLSLPQRPGRRCPYRSS
jgi:hypothetical protein